MARLLIVHHTPSPATSELLDAVVRGASDPEITGVEVVRRAALAATADAAISDALAVCVGSCGPGSTHLVNGLYDAQRTRVPVLVIAAQIPESEIGSQYFQETHPEALFADCSVYTQLIATPEMAPRILEIAMREAVEKRGVAVVVVPGEIFLAPSAEHHYVSHAVRLLGAAKASTVPTPSAPTTCKNGVQELRPDHPTRAVYNQGP